MTAARTLVPLLVACAAAGCAHGGARDDVTAMMTALEDVRDLHPPTHPPVRRLDDHAFDEACVRNLRATVWLPPGTPDPEPLFRTQCASTVSFYERAGDRLCIKRDALAGLSPADQFDRLAIELVHAIEAHALPPPPKQMTSDGRIALGALVEGDATFTSLAYKIKAHGSSIDRETWAVGTAIQMREASSLGDPSVFAHWLGMRFVLALYQHGGFRAVDAAFAHPPSSTSQILHPDRYLEPQGAPPAVSSRLPLPSPYVAEETMVQGEQGLRAFLSRCVPPEVAMEVGNEWDGDAFTPAKSTAAGTPMGRWVTAWRSEAGAKRFSGVIGESYECLFRTGVSMASRGRFVVVVTGPDAAVRQKHAKEVLADVADER